MNSLKVLRRLKRSQVDLGKELDRRLRRAAKSAAAVVTSAVDPKLVGSAMARAKVYARMQAEFAAEAKKSSDALKAAVASVAGASHSMAVDDIKGRPGKIEVGDWAKFDPKRAERYMELISPENGQDLFGASFGNMANASIKRMRAGFVDVYRQSQVEGLTLQKTAKLMQGAWDDIAGDLDAYRFQDVGGRAWANADYLNMVARTTLSRAHRESYLDTLAAHGDDLVRVQTMGENCPICDAWAGMILSMSGADRRYPSYSDSLAGGMWHPNCTCVPAGVVDALEGDDIARQSDEPNALWTDPEKVQEYNDEIKLKEKMAGGMSRDAADIDLKRDKLKHRLDSALLGRLSDEVDQIPDDVLKQMTQAGLPRFEYMKKGDNHAYHRDSKNGGVIRLNRDADNEDGGPAAFKKAFYSLQVKRGVQVKAAKAVKVKSIPKLKPKAVPQSLSLGEQKAIDFKKQLKAEGYNQTIIDRVDKMPKGTLDGIAIPDVAHRDTKSDAYYLDYSNYINLDKDSGSWNGLPQTFDHEFGHALHSQTRAILGGMIDPDFENAIKQDLEAWKKKVKTKYGKKWRYECSRRGSHYRDFNESRKGINANPESRTANGERYREMAYADIVGGLNKGNYGYGHSAAYYKKLKGVQGYKEVYANIYTAKVNGWKEIENEFPLTSAWIGSSLGI